MSELRFTFHFSFNPVSLSPLGYADSNQNCSFYKLIPLVHFGLIYIVKQQTKLFTHLSLDLFIIFIVISYLSHICFRAPAQKLTPKDCPL